MRINYDLVNTQIKTMLKYKATKKLGSVPASEMSKTSQYAQIALCLK